MKCWEEAHTGRQKADGRLPGAGKVGMGVGGRRWHFTKAGPVRAFPWEVATGNDGKREGKEDRETGT